MKVGIINYGIGNISSVAGSLNNIGIEHIIIKKENEFDLVDKLILPGIGNFRKCKEILDNKNFSSKIKEKVLKDKIPILGICLGMQLLASCGNEGSDESFVEGLNLIDGKVVSLKDLGSSLVLPHIGWNNIKIKNQSNLIKNIPMNTDFYFVHSYAYTQIEERNIIAVASYGVEFPALINYQNIWGAQFHPEKSSRAGLEIIKNFIKN
jgi:glutamine amidotransferase